MGAAQLHGEVVGHSQYRTGVSAADGHREGAVSGLFQAERALEDPQGSRAGSSPRVNRLVGVADGCHCGPVFCGDVGCRVGCLGVEEGGDEFRLRGGRVLVFVEQDVRVPVSVLLADGRESSDQLVGGDGEIAEFRHAGFPFGLFVGFDQVEQDVALPGHIQ